MPGRRRVTPCAVPLLSRMNALSRSERQTLDAALGWLGLGLLADAQKELEALPESARAHPAVLDVQYADLGEGNQWDDALAVAELEVPLHPERPGCWIHRAFAARRRPGGTLEEAYRLLHPAFERFPEEVVIPYNLACYRAQQDQLDEAWRWFAIAVALGDLNNLKEMARNDDDLKALWPKIAALK